MMRALHQHYGPLPRSRVIANGRNPNRFQTITKEPFILSAGRAWDEGKNVDALLSVADKLKWPVFVAGATEAPHGMRRTLKGVRPLGPLPNASLATWYSVAAIYALPARYEPFGLTALEAAFSGCALVLGDIDSLREVWGDAALYVKPDDHASLQDTLNALSADPERLSHYAALAQRRAQNYTTQRCATRYWSAYESLLTMEDDLTCASYSSITH
jgi:glycosyltransferase involved in cell wall biosynthesis